MVPDDPVESDDLEAALRGLVPAASQLDVSSVFYQAGFQAAMKKNSADGVFRRPALLAAILTAVIIAPISYRAGSSRNPIAAKPPIELQAVVQTDQQSIHDTLAVEHEPAAAAILASREGTTAANPLFELLVDSWFAGDQARGRQQTTTLTAFHASSVQSGDIAKSWMDTSFGLGNRYQTFPRAGAVSATKTLAISDTIELAETLGDY